MHACRLRCFCCQAHSGCTWSIHAASSTLCGLFCSAVLDHNAAALHFGHSSEGILCPAEIHEFKWLLILCKLHLALCLLAFATSKGPFQATVKMSHLICSVESSRQPTLRSQMKLRLQKALKASVSYACLHACQAHWLHQSPSNFISANVMSISTALILLPQADILAADFGPTQLGPLAASDLPRLLLWRYFPTRRTHRGTDGQHQIQHDLPHTWLCLRCGLIMRSPA